MGNAARFFNRDVLPIVFRVKYAIRTLIRYINSNLFINHGRAKVLACPVRSAGIILHEREGPVAPFPKYILSEEILAMRNEGVHPELS